MTAAVLLVGGTGAGEAGLVDVGVPTALLTITFLLKLFVDRTVELPMFVEGLYELPVEMGFLATSFIAAFTVASSQNTAVGLTHFVIYVALTILTIFFWRRSQAKFERDAQIASVLFFAPNFALSLILLLYSIRFVTGGAL